MSTEPVIVIDTREPDPSPWQPVFEVPTVRGTLQAGDYSVEGFEQLIAVERKSLGDLLTCIGRERDRWRRCLDRLRARRFRLVIIEASCYELELGDWDRGIHRNAALGSLAAWICQYNVPIWAGGTPEACARFAERFMRHALRVLESECPRCCGLSGGTDEPDSATAAGTAEPAGCA